MKADFSDTKIVEISMAYAPFNMISRLNDSFCTELETEDHNRKQWDAVDGVTVEDIEVFASQFAVVGAAERKVKTAAE
ncbi:MAG: hypothetical protein ABJ360_27900 [Roseobacter sp.]